MTMRLKNLIGLGIGTILFATFIVLPSMLLWGEEVVTFFFGSRYSQCRLYQEAELRNALAEGLKVNGGCCVEHMIGECFFFQPNSTHLNFAAERSDTRAAELLIANGADVNLVSHQGYPLVTAVRSKSLPLVSLLLESGANEESRRQALRFGVHLAEKKLVELLLQGFDSQHLPRLCAGLLCDLSQELIQPGTSIDGPHGELVPLLVSCSDVNAECDNERLLGRYGRRDEWAPVVSALLARGADLDLPQQNGKSVRDYLRSFNDYESRPRMKAILEQTRPAPVR